MRPAWHTEGLHITPCQYELMRVEASDQAPEEACGLVAGRAGLAQAILPIENELHSPARFRMAAQQQVDALMEMEEMGWELLAIYHSHPMGPPGPSSTDLAEFAYPEAISLIWSRQEKEWICRAYQIRDGQASETRLFVSSAD